MAFIFSGETVATLKEFVDRPGPGPKLMILIKWAPRVTDMQAALFDAAGIAVQSPDVPTIIVTDPMGVTMRTPQGVRVNLTGPKTVVWCSNDPLSFYCRHAANGQVGLLTIPGFDVPRVAVSVNTGAYVHI